MIKSPVPTIGLVNDAYKTLKNTLGESYDLLSGKDELFGLGKEGNDRSPRLSKTLPWFPGVGGIIRFFDVMSSEIQYDTVNQ